MDLMDLKMEAIHKELDETFKSGLTRPLKYRQEQLLALAKMMQENNDRFALALNEDLGKPAMEIYMGETGPIIQRAVFAATNVKKWAEPDDKVDVTPDWQKSWKPRVHREPKGKVLVIAPWNYPIILSLQPLLGAISAGCVCIVKPSELAPTYAALLEELFPKYLDSRAYRVVNGGVPETTRLLEMKWDHICYTGNGNVGRIIAMAAAKHLTPVTLELGGKSPVIVDPDFSNPGLAAKRILYGKCTNAGQICVTPDYVLLPAKCKDAFLQGVESTLEEFFPNNNALESPHISKIVNATHFARLDRILSQTQGNILFGGRSNAETLKMEPTVVLFDGQEEWTQDSLMQGEIFGPILPVIVLQDDAIEQSIQYVASRDHPLALYVFTEQEAVQERIRARTSSGYFVLNDTFMQLAVEALPLGGVGESGYGRQVGKYAFDAFTYERSSVDISLASEPYFAGRYAPYTEAKTKPMRDLVMMRIPEIQELEC